MGKARSVTQSKQEGAPTETIPVGKDTKKMCGVPGGSLSLHAVALRAAAYLSLQFSVVKFCL